ncbi:hypothetical protein F5Y15DRAFT_419986 [Xylariaceae sp. FL0016]|nr:hypothetical protein F5Y15DRAFT_419986 [Xylariaceae sp. FL0016]
MAQKTPKDSEAQVRSWGFDHVFTWTDGPNAHYQPHSHAGLTTHLILNGQLTITYPKDDSPEKKTYSVGDRIDVDAGRIHEVWMGPEGCLVVRRVMKTRLTPLVWMMSPLQLSSVDEGVDPMIIRLVPAQSQPELSVYYFACFSQSVLYNLKVMLSG